MFLRGPQRRHNGPIYTGDGYIIRLGQARAKDGSSYDNPSVYKQIIRLDEFSTMVRLIRRTIAIAQVDG